MHEYNVLTLFHSFISWFNTFNVTQDLLFFIYYFYIVHSIILFKINNYIVYVCVHRGLTTWDETDFPSFSMHWVFIVFHLAVGTPWLIKSLFRSHLPELGNHIVKMLWVQLTQQIWKALSSRKHLGYLTLKIFPLPHLHSGCIVDVQIGIGHTMATYSLNFY